MEYTRAKLQTPDQSGKKVFPSILSLGQILEVKQLKGEGCSSPWLWMFLSVVSWPHCFGFRTLSLKVWRAKAGHSGQEAMTERRLMSQHLQ